MENKKLNLLIWILISSLLLIGNVIAIGAGISDEGVEYDSELLGQFSTSNWVYVTVDVKDTTNITIPNRKSPDFESKLQQRNVILIEETNAVLSTLSKDEFQLKTNSEFGGFFSGNLTKEGFYKLLNDKRVRKIYAKKEFHIYSGKSLKNLLLCIFLVALVFSFVILLTKLKRKKRNTKKIMLIGISFILLFIINLISVSAEINLNKDNPLEGISNEYVKYDREILDNFNLTDFEKEDFMSGNLKDTSSNVGRVYVTVDVKDTTNITIPNRKSPDFESKLQQRNVILIEETNAVLSTLSKDEFQLKTNSEFGGFFSGNLTKEGFYKLLNDKRVRKIYAKKEFSLSLYESAPLINADNVWGSYNGSGQTVCIIDTGINYTHDYLSQNYLEGYDYYDNDADPMDGDGHGTHVSGIVASTNSAQKGIANGAGIVALRVTDDEGNIDENAVKSSLQWCLNNAGTYNISVVSMSFGKFNGWGPCGENYADVEIDNLYDAGITLIAASGNDGNQEEVSYPACNSQTISVGATYDTDVGSKTFCTLKILGICLDHCTDESTGADQITCFSNRGDLLALLAPGCEITSTFGGGFGTTCGTSQAAPMVAGAAALLLEKVPYLSPSEIKSTFQDTGVTVGSWKRIDVEAALDSFCVCGDFSAGSCGSGGCNSEQKPHTRTCSPSGCSTESVCVYDEACKEGEEQPAEGSGGSCSESGYFQCYEYGYGDCDVKLAANWYENVPNTIKWGAVEDAWDPYVIGEYKIGWKGVDAEQMYYDIDDPNNDCTDSGCTGGEELAQEGTKTTVTAPGKAHTKTVLAYDSTENYYCWAYFNPFYPSYEDNPYIYVLNCYDDDDCSAGEYCDNSGDWANWDCINDKSDGQSCTRDAQCSSGYCDNDGAGLDDDGWCFTPSSTYFDGQEPTRCELSTGYGISACDERQTGYDFGQCLGIPFYEDECGSTCDYQDITSVFECDETGCSCSQPLCDGLAAGSNISTCSAGETYFADNCTSAAEGQDRGDNICRSSAFATGCTADEECNGQEAGIGYCNSNCTSVENPPVVTLVTPQNNNLTAVGDVIFNCSATDDNNLTNITLYHDLNGTWQANETKTLTGTSGSATFTIDNIPKGSYKWNCLAYDNASQPGWGDENYSLKIGGEIAALGLSEIYANGSARIFIFKIRNNLNSTQYNVNWIMDTNETTINSTEDITLTANEEMPVYVKYNLTQYGTHNINVTLNSGSYYDSTNMTISYSLPNDPSPTINSTSGTNTTDQDLNCIFTPTDSDPDETLTANITWYKDGTINLTLASIPVTQDQEYASVLSSVNTTKGEQWSCGVQICDNENLCSNWVNSTQLEILNSPPTTPTDISGFPASLYITNTLTLSASGSTDADNDAITYYYKFNSTDGTLQDWSTTNNHTIQISDAHDTIYVYAKAVTPDANSTLYYENDTVNDLDPTIPSLKLPTTNTSTTDSTPFFNWTASTDADNDTITYEILIDDETNFTLPYVQSDSTLTSNDYTATTLNDGTYYWKVKAITSYANSSYTDYRVFKIDTTPPDITEVITINEENVVGGEVRQGDNVTFNVTVNDEDSDVESVWLKIWGGAIGISNILWQGFLSLITEDLWSVTVETNESFPTGNINYTIYSNDTLGNEANLSGNFTTVLPDLYKFFIKDPSGNNVAWLGELGNIVLKGTCTVSATCAPPANSFIIKAPDDNTVAYIDPDGNLCLESGTCNDYQPNCDNPGDGSFIVRNDTDTNVAFINSTGSLCLIGNMIENGDP